jgi:CRP-like cAMP-binding protein
MINPFRKTYTDKELILFRFLRRIKLFERLNNKELSYFLPYLYLRQYDQEEVVFFRGDPSHALYIVKSGRVALTVDVNDTFEALTEIQTNNAFGDNALLEGTKRIYTAIVKSHKAELYVVPHVNLMELFEEHPEMKAKVMTSLAELYNRYTSNLFKAYQSSFGFFDLSKTYENP